MGKKGKGKGKGRASKARPSKFSKGRPTELVPVPEPEPEPVFDRSLPVFSFDFTVMRLDVTGVALTDPRKLVVLVTFGGNNISLTASKTDISEFKPYASLSFQKECADLAQNMAEEGLYFEVRYEDELVGLGRVLPPKSLTDSINLDMKEISYTNTCTLELDQKPSGSLEFLCKLFIKCGDYPRDGENCRNLNRNIDPEDIVFVIGKSQANPSCCDPCRDALEIEAQKEKDYIIQTGRNW